ncbi:MAG: hypothetical protein ACRDQZ_26330, partial [Mycobacteriales bacterium]
AAPELRTRAEKSSEAAFNDPPPALRLLSNAEVVSQLLVPYLRDLGTDREELSVVDLSGVEDGFVDQFAEAGFRAEQVEPGDKKTVALRLAAPGLSVVRVSEDSAVLSETPLSSIESRLILFDVASREGGLGEKLHRLIEGARSRGRNAAAFTYSDYLLPGLQTPELLRIVFDRALERSTSEAVRLILYDHHDRTFLAQLVRLIESNLPPSVRPT